MKEITYKTFSDGTVVLEVIQGKIERFHQTLKKWLHGQGTGRLRHLGSGRAHAGKHVLMLIHDTAVTISDTGTGTGTGEIIGQLTIDPTRDYQPRQRKTPRP
jgi:hypothetical protein